MSRGRYAIGSDPSPFVAPSYGLLSTATPIDLGVSQWRMGATWEPLCPSASVTYDPCVTLVDNGGTLEPVEDAPDEKSETFEWNIQGATPFTAYTQIECSPVGVWDELPERSRNAIVRAEELFVENMFWRGRTDPAADTFVFPHLAADAEVEDGQELMQPAAQVVTSSPQDVETGIGMLEAAIRDCYPGVPTLHIPLRLGSLLANHSNFVVRNGRAYTATGSPIVLGGGYPGTSPAGEVPATGTTWIYATGPVFYQRSNTVQFSRVESLDRSDNTVRIITERTYLVGFNCCLFAIPILNGELTEL